MHFCLSGLIFRSDRVWKKQQKTWIQKKQKNLKKIQLLKKKFKESTSTLNVHMLVGLAVTFVLPVTSSFSFSVQHWLAFIKLPFSHCYCFLCILIYLLWGWIVVKGFTNAVLGTDFLTLHQRNMFMHLDVLSIQSFARLNIVLAFYLSWKELQLEILAELHHPEFSSVGS